MGIGPTITDDVKRLIIETKLEYPDLAAKHVMAEVHRKLGGGDWPGISAIQKIISKHVPSRRPSSTEPEKIGLGEESPWSFGKGTDYDIPWEATSDLLRVQHWCLAIGYNLTIREAKWIARLASLSGPGIHYPLHPLDLTYWGYRYALRERACTALNSSMTTPDLDQELIYLRLMDSKEQNAFFVLIGNQLDPRGDIDDMEYAIGHGQGGPPDQFYARLFVERAAGLMPLPSPAWPPFHTLEPRYINDELLTYFYWLRHISRGPRWGGLTRPKRREIADELLQQVQASQALEEWRPAEIMREVGYEG